MEGSIMKNVFIWLFIVLTCGICVASEVYDKKNDNVVIITITKVTVEEKTIAELKKELQEMTFMRDREVSERENIIEQYNSKISFIKNRITEALKSGIKE